MDCCVDQWINIITCATTVGFLVVAWSQLNKMNQQAKADFLYRFNRDFFLDNETNRIIIKAIENNKKLLSKNSKIDEFAIDDYLGYFDLMKQYIDKKMMTFKDVDITFGHYIASAWENEEIKKYITDLRKKFNDTRYYKEDARYYKDFETIANKILKERIRIKLK